jgi:7-cyano-7-deazaguanine reductase
MSEERVREDEGLTLLGNRNVKYDTEYNPDLLETFENKHPDNDYWVKFNCPEFTSLCPITGQPDFATIYISYVPSVRMVESKSLKLYLFSYRNHGDFHEDCVNKIMKDLIRLMDPKYIEVHGRFLPRGGISIDPYCNYGKKGTKWEKIAENRLAWHDLNDIQHAKAHAEAERHRKSAGQIVAYVKVTPEPRVGAEQQHHQLAGQNINQNKIKQVSRRLNMKPVGQRKKIIQDDSADGDNYHIRQHEHQFARIKLPHLPLSSLVLYYISITFTKPYVHHYIL